MKLTLILASAVSAMAALAAPVGQKQSRNSLSAPTYYVVARVSDCEREPSYIDFRGASNLPSGSVIDAQVSDFDFDGWKDYSSEVHVPVNEEGFFTGRIEPEKGMSFRGSLILRVYFLPYRPKQPESVLAVVGKHGEHLGGESVAIEQVDPSKNPQMFQVSGWYYGLETMARLPNCGQSK